MLAHTLDEVEILFYARYRCFLLHRKAASGTVWLDISLELYQVSARRESLWR